jgi:hypothetical protein
MDRNKKVWMQLCIAAAILFSLLTAGASAASLGPGQYFIWGIGQNELTIPTGSVITEAVLTFQNVSPNDAAMRVYLLDNPDVGTQSGNAEDVRVSISEYGEPLAGVNENGNFVCRLSQINDVDSHVWSIFSNPCYVALADGSSAQMSSAILDLLDYAGTGKSFGFGFFPQNNQSMSYGRMELVLTLRAYDAVRPDEQLTFTVGEAVEDDEGNTEPVIVIYEAEDAVLSGPRVSKSIDGYTGTGFADYINSKNDYIEWTVNAVSAGSYELMFRYALNSGNRSLQIKVNGQVVAAGLSFPSTGSWSSWGAAGTTAVLNAGVNTVRATVTGSSGANVDHLQVIPLVPDTSAPNPNPLAFAAAPTPISSVSISMTATTAVDVSGVEYFFECTGGGGHNSGWQGSPAYIDTGLSPSVQYSYRVKARDKSVGLNETGWSSILSATTPQMPVITIYEAEDAVLSGAAVANNMNGYTGTGFADYLHPSGDYIEWTVNVAAAGQYELAFRYALSGSNRPLQISVNGQVVNAGLAFPGTGSWTAWSTTETTVTLQTGINIVRATAIGSSGANVDNLRVVAR